MSEKVYLFSKEKKIIIDSSGELLINGKKYEPVDREGKPIMFDKKEEAVKQTRDFYRSILSLESENLVILSGAGTSVGIGKTGKGKTMSDLWKLAKGESTIDLAKLCKDIEFDDSEDLEKLLSKAHRALEFKPGNIINKIEAIENLIKDNCSLELPDNSPHEVLLNRIVKRKLKYPRSKVFTLNYDTLFEQAAEKGGLIAIDGFSFATPRTFRGALYDYDIVKREKSRIKNEENFIPKVFHLYKIHGSINWEMNLNQVIQTRTPLKPLMIFPKDTKYEHSYEKPFFEMMSRFQQSLRNENVLLISLGFSLSDKHIVTAIKEAVSQNPSFQIMIVNRTIRDNPEWKWFLNKAEVDSRITLISEEFNDFAPNYPEDKTITKEEMLKKVYDNE